MKIFNIIKSLLFVLAIIFIFFNWKIAIAIFLVASIFHVIPMGPNPLLSVITGYLIIGGVIYLFINWKIGIVLIIGGFLVTKFRIYGNKCNYDFYKKNKNSNIDEKNNDLEKFFEKTYKTHFPGGKDQIKKQTNEIIKLSNGKLDFEKAQSILLKGMGMLSINKSRVYDSIKLNFSDVLNKDELKIMTAFIIFNSVNESTIKLVEIGFNTENIGYNEDEMPIGQGKFGLCATNPVPVNGLIASEEYLERLRTIDGKKIKWGRKGSIEPTIKGIIGMIDIYDISDEGDNHLGELYISPYNQKLSTKAPLGFKLISQK